MIPTSTVAEQPRSPCLTGHGCDQCIWERFPSRMFKAKEECSQPGGDSALWGIPGKAWRHFWLLHLVVGVGWAACQWPRGKDQSCCKTCYNRKALPPPACLHPCSQHTHTYTHRSILAPNVHSAETEKSLLSGRNLIIWKKIHLCGSSQSLMMQEKEAPLSVKFFIPAKAPLNITIILWDGWGS